MIAEVTANRATSLCVGCFEPEPDPSPMLSVRNTIHTAAAERAESGCGGSVLADGAASVGPGQASADTELQQAQK